MQGLAESVTHDMHRQSAGAICRSDNSQDISRIVMESPRDVRLPLQSVAFRQQASPRAVPYSSP